MFRHMKQILIGKPLRNEAAKDQKYSVLLGLPILSSDSVSSVAYASEEILIVLTPVIGALAYRELGFVSAAIVALLLILTFSYRQTIHAYPNGGGAFVVAGDNLGRIAGLTAGAALSVDYTLTVAVSISSGTAAITSAFPALLPYTIPICLFVLVLLTLGNLRGIREASRIFSIPTYAFIVLMLLTILTGVIRHFTGSAPQGEPPASLGGAVQPVTLLLLLAAFSNGCSALTGVEAVSNAIPNFRKPSVRNAQRVLLLMSMSMLLLFGGVSLLANLYHAVPNATQTVLSQIVWKVYGGGFFFYLIQASTAVVLVMAANTSFSGFPLLASIIGAEGYAPRQLSMRGDRLSFSNGILALSIAAGILIIVFRGNTNALIPLYAIGVFISFTLSQFGMFRHWIKHREPHWVHKAVINGLGALVTCLVVIIIACTKFIHGAWLVVIVVPLLVAGMLVIKRHYSALADQLRVNDAELKKADIEHCLYHNRVIVPIASVNKASLRALRYAETISSNVVAFNVSIDEESGAKLRSKYACLQTKVPLVIKYSPYRRIVDPLLKFISSEEYAYVEGDIITVILPEFEVRHIWEKLLHNGTGRYITRRLLKYKHIVVATIPLQLRSEGLPIRGKKHP